jgi:putative nucleotidyltransferase with HDIG domain
VRELAWPTPNSLAFALLALLVSMLYRDTGGVAVVFILVPLFVLRRARYGKIDLDTARERTLLAFVRAVELKSPYTWRHSERVAEIALELHALLGTNERAREDRRRAALLHDIGKVAVSGRILDKRGKLDDAEWDEMRRHPTTGAMVVTGVDYLHDIAPEVLYHHERLDGSGYPSGLKGDEIPYEARVLAVADTFEALTSDRPYRRALSSTEAHAEIRRWAGIRLDPTVVDALTRLLETTDLGPAVRVPVVLPDEAVRSLAREA